MDDKKTARKDKPATEPPPAETPAPATPAPKKSAMRLPPGAGAGASRGPQQPRPWENGAGGARPRTDAERLKGKSRKVH